MTIYERKLKEESFALKALKDKLFLPGGFHAIKSAIDGN